MIIFDGQVFNDTAELKRYCNEQLEASNDGDSEARAKYDLDYDCDQDWMQDR